MLTNFAFLNLGAPELLIILVIALLLFGGKKLPQLSKSIGQSIQELKKGTAGASGLQSEIQSEVASLKDSFSGMGERNSSPVVTKNAKK